ncbi:MAG: MFS transporter, partial [Candidatus Eisenbacteria bacterium]|nr:MFS transporter [Candidatus Latescibacterota bacterium]MBD3301949.1 MFS transporter [Candidatus Eisenbacteria bacterium]
MTRRPLEPYRALLADNPEFRRLWFGQIISQLGDWFSSIAIYSLLIERTGSGEAVALAMLAQFLPMFVIGPPAGVLADRVDPRRILIVTDVLRAVVVAGLILAERRSGVGLVYALLISQVVLSAFFEPARAALVPTVTKRKDWLAANTLAGMTWSVMLALGAGLGGGVSALLGRAAAFGIDSVTFLASAAVLWGLRSRQPDPSEERGLAAPAREFREGLAYVARNRGLAAILSVKSLWGIGGGILLLYTVFGERLFPLGEGAAASIGLLYAARGIGAAVGPILGRWLLGSSPEKLRRNIALSFFLGGICYLGFAQAPNLPVALVLAFGSHIGGSMMWVFSTTLLQLACPER